MSSRSSQGKSVETLTHQDDKRKNIPTAEYESVMGAEEREALELRYPRNPDLDPQLVWRGKDEQDWSDLVVHAPPLYIQEKVHPKFLIDDLQRFSAREADGEDDQPDLFADFNGIPEGAEKTEFYRHDQNWSNRMILGDSLQVMASLAEREGLRGKVQCIYIDPPYGIKFNSNFQWSTTTRDVKDGKAEHIAREPEVVKAFRDTWRDGIHSYLTYLRDRLTVARDLLSESGSIFVQIGDENVHRVRALLDEVFGDDCFLAEISVVKTTGVMAATSRLNTNLDTILWYGRSSEIKFREVFQDRSEANNAIYNKLLLADGTIISASRAQRTGDESIPEGATRFRFADLLKAGPGAKYEIACEGRSYNPGAKWWGTRKESLERAVRAARVRPSGRFVSWVGHVDDFRVQRISNLWTDTTHLGDRVYVVQTAMRIVERCILLTTDPGDLVLDPTCGSGTTAYVAEQWGRRWITIDTSRVALALARARIMGARYPYYLLADSPAGQEKEAEITRTAPSTRPTHGNIRHGFVYERVPHITLKSIANNAEIDVIWEKRQPQVEGALAALNGALRGHGTPFRVRNGGRQGKPVRFDAPQGATFTMPSGEVVLAHELVEWEVPRETPEDWPPAAHGPLAAFWEARIGRQQEIDASIAAKADFEYLYDRPYEERKTVRVAGPFTVESLSPHRVLALDENDDLVDPAKVKEGVVDYAPGQGFEDMILENLKAAGVQQAHREDRIDFTALTRWPGRYICAEGRYREGDAQRRAGIFIGPEFGTVSRPDLVDASREASDAGFDVLIACAFNYDAHASEFDRLGRIPILKARMNADLHMADDLQTTRSANLFVIFGEPDITVEEVEDGRVQVQLLGVDVFDPSTGEVRSDNADGIASWFIDTDYDGESFFVRHAYFLGQNDPYKALKTTLKAEIDEDAWATLNSDTSRPFDKPRSGRIAVKVINHLGDEVMKVFRV